MTEVAPLLIDDKYRCRFYRRGRQARMFVKIVTGTGNMARIAGNRLMRALQFEPALCIVQCLSKQGWNESGRCMAGFTRSQILAMSELPGMLIRMTVRA